MRHCPICRSELERDGRTVLCPQCEQLYDEEPTTLPSLPPRRDIDE